MRKLLPYEHQLVESLGISKEQYLDFVAIQRDYKDPKAGTALDVRNEVGTVALVLTIVGILFQVGAALLTPKPEIPGARDRRRQRQQRFAPTFGFNSTQELATYGDPVNLVYTNTDQNPQGGVRVSGALVWSAIENFGSTQFMQLLMVLGASKIREIDPEKTAFGQLAIDSLNPGLIWIFYKNSSGLAGTVEFKDRVFGDIELFPKSLKGTESSDVCLVKGNKKQGYSQAYSPTTSVALGVYDPIPLNVTVITRNKKGKEKDAPINIKLKSDSWISGTSNFYKTGETIDVKFESSNNKDGDDDGRGIAKDIRRQTAEALTYGATYMLGAAKFKLIEFPENSSQDVDEGDVTARFRCIEGGRRPTVEYKTTRPNTDPNTDFRVELENAEEILSNKGDNNEKIVTDDLKININAKTYDFTGNATVTWTNEIGKSKSYGPFSKGGSIENTKQLREDFLAEKPTLNVETLVTDIQNYIDLANEEIDLVNAGDFDDNESPLEDVIDDFLRTDRQNKDQKKRIGYINEKIQRIKDKRDVSFDKQTPKNALRNSSFLNDEGGTRAQRRALNELTEANLNKETNYEDQLDFLREKREKRRTKLINRARNKFTKPLNSKDSGEFTSELTGQKYPYGGIRAMEKRLKKLPSEGRVTDKVGVKAIKERFKQILDDKREALEAVRTTLEEFNDEYAKSLDNNFFVKCLVKCESASYETINECDYVRFSIKSKLFRRVSGRQKKYAEERAPEGYKNGDNGVKGRMAFFRVSYKKDTDTDYTIFPVIYVLRHGSESDFYNQLNFESDTRNRYSFKFDPVYDTKAEMLSNGQSIFGFIENSEREKKYSSGGVTFSWFGREVTSTNAWGFPNLEERGPRYTNEWDMFSVNTDTQVQFSHETGPELLITAVTEQQRESTIGKYENMSMMSVGITAGRGIQDLRNVTAFVTKGKDTYTAEDFINPSKSSTSFAPDIFADTVLNTENGVAKYVPKNALDQPSLIAAKNFCKNNNLPVEQGASISLYMDGVIADAGSWRSFWIENAPFSLLELARKNGADTLVPAIPIDASGKAAENSGKPVPLTISALFTPGNILEDSFKEEFLNYGAGTQDLIATVIYRETNAQDVFSTNRAVEVRRKGVSDDAIRQTFDASQFVTQKEQAIMFGKLLANQRHWIRKGIEFRTFPSESAIEPGSFIYVDIGLKDWDSYSTGVVMEGGALNTPIKDKVSDGTYAFLFYDTQTGKVSSETYAVSNNTAVGIADRYVGHMFVMGLEKPSKRVYRVTEVAIEEEGEVSVKALEYPCFTEGDDQPRARIADFRAADFKVS